MTEINIQDQKNSKGFAKIELVTENKKLTKMMNEMKFKPQVNKIRT